MIIQSRSDGWRRRRRDGWI